VTQTSIKTVPYRTIIYGKVYDIVEYTVLFNVSSDLYQIFNIVSFYLDMCMQQINTDLA